MLPQIDADTKIVDFGQMAVGIRMLKTVTIRCVCVCVYVCACVCVCVSLDILDIDIFVSLLYGYL